MNVNEARKYVCELHGELPKNNLVVWTAGNVSQKIDGEELFVIKPSGVLYSELTPENMVLCDFDGNKIEGDLSPSSDTAAHAYVYKNWSEIGGIVHTHSPYATAWAAIGKPIPCSLTMMGDEFGEDIPIGPFALIGDDSIGKGIVETLKGKRSPAVLMQNHGVFTIGKDAKSAVKAAVLTEEVAKTMAIANSIGDPIAIPQAKIDYLYDRYTNVYGQ